MSRKRHRHQPPPAEDHELRRVLLAGVVREVLEIILRELWRGGPWTI